MNIPNNTNNTTWLRRLVIALCLVLPFGPASARKGKTQAKAAEEKAVPGKKENPGETKSAPSGSASKDDYIIGPEDVLAVNVWREPEISRSVPVRPDGKISLPLIGELEASGLTAVKLQEILAEKLKEYVSHPQVTVIVQEAKSHKFNMIGKVLRPGSYDLAKPTTVLDAISLAGGFQDFAKVTKIYVLRRAVDGSQKMHPFNYKAVIKGRLFSQNIELKPGDTIVVP